MAALLGVVWAVWTGVRLLAPIKLQVSGLKAQWKEGTPIFRYFQADRAQLQGFDDFDDMDEQETAAYRRFDQLTEQLANARGLQRGKLKKELDDAKKLLEDILNRSDAVVSIANHVQYVHLFKERALKRLFGAAAVAAVGIVAFAWAANPPAPALSASLRRADLTGADLRGGNLRRVDLTDAVLSGADLTNTDLAGADLTNARLDGVVWSGTTCPDGTNSDDAAGSCVNHLQANAPSAESGGE